MSQPEAHSTNHPAPSTWTGSQGFESQTSSAMSSSSLEIPEALMKDLQAAAVESGISLEEALRRSIATTKLLRQEVREGNKILIRDRKGKYQEVVFLG